MPDGEPEQVQLAEFATENDLNFALNAPEDIDSLLSELDRVTRWRSIAEEQPEQGQRVLCLWKGGFTFVENYHPYFTSKAVTHWLPLPPLPQEGTTL